MAFSFSSAQIVTIPDPVFKAKLLSASTANFIANNGTAYVRIDTNFDNEIQLAEAAVIQKLFVDEANISSLAGIEAFVNLTQLNCMDNNLSTLDVNMITGLKRLDCGQNPMTALDISGLTGLNHLSVFQCSGLSSLSLNPAAFQDLNSYLEISGTSLTSFTYNFPCNGCSLDANQMPALGALTIDVQGGNMAFFRLRQATALLSLNIEAASIDAFSFNENPVDALDLSNVGDLGQLINIRDNANSNFSLKASICQRSLITNPEATVM